ncbi:hypothetical protein [Mameliella alba]|uniref:Uncharacterized protein n=1 Tax=Mameliella alba TaxID=561184 RepID=A0A0B3RQV4_9RHOB|nr:hypothetical protein [Mameliella alba]KHQ50267.1 hypothetical protein OA50_05115 [Mameliella alba]
MARNEVVDFEGSGWVELTNAENASGVVAIQNRGVDPVRVLATTDGTAPAASEAGGWSYLPGEADARTLADMFPGLTSPVRLWAKGRRGGYVMVSYA